MTTQTCTSEIVGMPRGGHAAALPFDPKEVFGRARAPVSVTVGDHEPFDTTIAVYAGVAYVGFRKAQLADMDLAVGDTVELTIERREQ